MGYSRGIVCFIDVLGSKDRVRDFDKLFDLTIQTFHNMI
jgi:hypothetical protein